MLPFLSKSFCYAFRSTCFFWSDFMSIKQFFRWASASRYAMFQVDISTVFRICNWSFNQPEDPLPPTFLGPRIPPPVSKISKYFFLSSRTTFFTIELKKTQLPPSMKASLISTKTKFPPGISLKIFWTSVIFPHVYSHTRGMGVPIDLNGIYRWLFVWPITFLT